jgi:hypothetical protein
MASVEFPVQNMSEYLEGECGFKDVNDDSASQCTGSIAPSFEGTCRYGWHACFFLPVGGNQRNCGKTYVTGRP